MSEEPKNEISTAGIVGSSELLAPLFLYLKGTNIGKPAMERLEKAGYIPMEVEDFNSVKVVQPEVMLASDPISQAALNAVLKSSGDFDKARFGKQVAEAYTRNIG